MLFMFALELFLGWLFYVAIWGVLHFFASLTSWNYRSYIGEVRRRGYGGHGGGKR
jgi:hypothetical protein